MVEISEEYMPRVWIPGGTSGIGKKVSDMLLERLFEEEDPELHFFPTGKDVDVRDPFQFDRSDDSYINCDVLLYFAGVNHDGLLDRIDQEEVNEIFDVNCLGFLNCVNACLPYMKSNKRGSIIYISSYLAKRTVRGTGIYSASKAWSESIVRTVAAEQGRYGIIANTVRLGYMSGGMTNNVPSSVLRSQLDKAPINHLIDIQDLVYTLLPFFGVSFMTGATLDLDGGISL